MFSHRQQMQDALHIIANICIKAIIIFGVLFFLVWSGRTWTGALLIMWITAKLIVCLLEWLDNKMREGKEIEEGVGVLDAVCFSKEVLKAVGEFIQGVGLGMFFLVSIGAFDLVRV